MKAAQGLNVDCVDAIFTVILELLKEAQIR
jgi:hypothetical protein